MIDEYGIHLRHICEPLRRLAGTYSGAIVRPVDAGDGEVGEVIWVCRDGHAAAALAVACAEGELANRRSSAREAAREQLAAGWAEGSDDPDSLEYRGR